MKQNPLVAFVLNAFSRIALSTPQMVIPAKTKAWSYDGCIQSDKIDNLPRGYPGAKLARRAVFKGIAVKHPRGLRVDGVTI